MRGGGWPGDRVRVGTITGLVYGLIGTIGLAQAQDPPRIATPARSETAVPVNEVLPDSVQVVRFTAPEGVTVEVLAPPPDPAPPGDGHGSLTVGLRTGVSYRLRLSNLPGRSGESLYPVVEMIGHLHRPPMIDPGRFPIRIPFRVEDLEDVSKRSRLVVQVVYLEDPEQAIPVALPKEEIPTAHLSPGEDPIKVAAALGRVMAIVRLGDRMPDPEELTIPPGMAAIPCTRCPFVGTSGGPCALPLGPVCGTPPPLGRLWIPKDEYLCDGGDHGSAASFGGDGGLRGLDPRDAIVQFARPRLDQLLPEIEKLRQRFENKEISAETYGMELRRLTRSVTEDRRPKLLPTNVVCLYAPRFASVRTSVGPNENLTVQSLREADRLQSQQQSTGRQDPVRLVKEEMPAAHRHRVRPSEAAARLALNTATEVRVLAGFDVPRPLASVERIQAPAVTKGRQGPGKIRTAEAAVAIKTGESVIVKAKVEGAGQTLMAWKPQEMAGVEFPPNQPGLAVVKRTSASIAEPGDRVTFTINYRNMGNVPLSDVSIVDSLLPRFAYVPGSAQGPEGTVFTASENRVGAMELRWDLPGILAPGAAGHVTFEVEVR